VEIAQLISEGKQKKRLKNKQSLEAKKCFEMGSGDEEVISLLKK
jgi:hypothetical protein